jgi:hypothetical protein
VTATAPGGALPPKIDTLPPNAPPKKLLCIYVIMLLFFKYVESP